jgi:hypothetical protein
MSKGSRKNFDNFFKESELGKGGREREDKGGSG